MRRLLTVSLRAPRSTLAVVLAVTAFFGFFAVSFQVDGSPNTLLVPDDPQHVYYETVVKPEFGDDAVTVIGIFADDVFTPATLAKIETLSDRLAGIDGVREVISLTTVQGIEVDDSGLVAGRLMKKLPQTAEEANAFRERVLGDPLYVKNVVSADGRAAAITVVFDPMSDEEFEARHLEQRVRDAVAALEGPERFAIAGLPTIKVHAARFMERDTLRFIPPAITIMVLVLIWAFRTVRGVVLPLATVLVGVIWTTGLMVLTDTPITLSTLVLNPLLMAVGIAYSIHVMCQYYEQLETGRPPAQVVKAALQHVLVPLGIAALTTIVGFTAFIFTPIPAIREFGAYAVFGIGVIFVASITVLPAVLLLLPPEKQRSRIHDEGNWLAGILRFLGNTAVHHGKLTLLVAGVICVVSLMGLARINVETDILGFFRPQSEIRKDNAMVASHLAGTQPIYVVVDGHEPQSVVRLDVLRSLDELQSFIDRQPSVDKTLSLVDYLAEVRKAFGAEPGRLPKSNAELQQLLQLIDPQEIRSLLNRDGSRANLIVRTSLSGSREVAAFVDAVQSFAAEHFSPQITVTPTGTVVLINRSADVLAWGQISSLWQVFVVLLILMSMLFLSFRVGLLSLVPNVFPIIVLFGIMGWSGISLNISTSLIAVLAIGIAIDDTIHFFSAFNEQMRATGSQEQAVRNAASTMGKPMIVTSVALCGGFLVVCLSSFAPVQHFGYLASATMAVALLADLFISPAVVMTTKIITLWDLLFLKLGAEPQKQIRMFAGLRPFQAKLAVLMGHLEAAAPGAYITRKGELKPEMYVLLNGRAEVRGRDSEVLRVLARGSVVGEMGLVRHRPRSADVVATEKTEFVVLDERFLQRIEKRYPRIAAKVFLNLTRILSDRLQSTTDAVVLKRRT